VVGGSVGLGLALILTILSPAVWVTVFGNAAPVFPYSSPAIFSVPAAFLTIWLVSLLDRSPRAAEDRAGFADQEVRSETGIGAFRASGH
jgi:cation/acetate symporter